uniref:Putative RecA n=1 Tax=viral metagenome TaxID=1070528 RepID=A0A6M3JQ94_9ZZZZ
MVDVSDIVKKAVRTLKGKYGTASIGSSLPDKAEYVSTGNLAFDLISDGGIPFGYCIEFLGLSSSGKSTIIYKVMANSQRDYDAICILADRENAYNNPNGDRLGINNDNLILANARDIPSPREGFQFILDSIESIRKHDKNIYIVVGLDSIAAFGKDVTFEKADAGRKAKISHEGMREVISRMDDKIMFMVANQVTYKIGSYGDNRTSTAGESMKYYSNLRFALQDAKKIVDSSAGNEVIGSWIGVEAIKTRLGPCYRTCYIKHLYETGIDWYSGYARLLANRGYLKPKNSKEYKAFNQVTLKYKDHELNENNTEEWLKTYPELVFDKYPVYNMNESADEIEDESTELDNLNPSFDLEG